MQGCGASCWRWQFRTTRQNPGRIKSHPDHANVTISSHLPSTEFRVSCSYPARQGARQTSLVITSSADIFWSHEVSILSNFSFADVAKHSLTQSPLNRKVWPRLEKPMVWSYFSPDTSATEEMRLKLEVTDAEICRCPIPPLWFLPWRSSCMFRKSKSPWNWIMCCCGGWISRNMHFSSFPWKTKWKKKIKQTKNLISKQTNLWIFTWWHLQDWKGIKLGFKTCNFNISWTTAAWSTMDSLSALQDITTQNSHLLFF